MFDDDERNSINDKAICTFLLGEYELLIEELGISTNIQVNTSDQEEPK